MRNKKLVLLPLFLSLFSVTFSSCNLLPQARSSKEPYSQEDSSSDFSEPSSFKRDDSTQHIHTFSNSWWMDQEYHWKESNCEHEGIRSEYGRHDFVLINRVESTYNASGYELYRCSICGYDKYVDLLMLEHHYSDVYSYDNEFHWQQCEDLGYEDLVINRAEHDLYKIEDVEATYEYEGRLVYGCTVCSYTSVTVYPPSGHVYSSEWSYNETVHYHACLDEGYTDLKADIEGHTMTCIESQPATYEAEGYNIYQCTICQYTRTESIEKLEHRFNSAWTFDDTAHWHSCKDAGYEHLRADYAEHTFVEYSRSEATYDSPSRIIYRCSICSRQKTVVNDDQLVHNFSTEWISDDEGHWHYCLDEGYSTLKGNFENHDYALSNSLQPTFEEEGYDEYTCIVCGHIKQEVKPKLEHSYSSGWSSDISGHWHRCLDAGYSDLKDGFEEHSIEYTYYGQYYNEVKCSVCGMEFYLDFEGCRLYPNPDRDDNGLLYYLMENGEYCVAGDVSVIDGDIILPASHNGLPVTRVMSSAFNDSRVRNVTISSGIIQIGSYAFCNCSQLISIDIPESINYIGYYAFASSSIESITIPAAVTTLEKGAFANCYGLTSVFIHEGITSIFGETFAGCGNLQQIIVDPNNRYYSDENGVLYNKNKTELLFCPLSISGEFVLPDNLSTINEKAFENCVKITAFAVGENNGYFSSENGILYNKNKTKLIAVPKSKAGEVIIPDTVREVVSSAFVNCRYITAVTIPYGMEEVWDSAFYLCMSLNSITIPETVTRIGNSAFACCESLESIILPNSVTYLDCNSFDGTAIRSLYLPASVERIDALAFQGSANIQSITVDPESQYFTSYNDVLYSKDMTKLVYFPGAKTGDFVIPEGVKECAKYAFYANYRVTSISFPSTFEQDLNNVEFVNCAALESVSVDENNKTYCSIDGVLFSKNLESLYLYPRARTNASYVVPEGVTVIKSKSFEFTNYLTLITLPRSLQKIEKNAFYGVGRLSDIIILSCEVTFERDCVKYCDYIQNIYLTTTIGDSGYVANVRNAFDNVNVYFYSDEEPSEHDVFWHYVEGLPVVW